MRVQVVEWQCFQIGDLFDWVAVVVS